MIGFSSNTSDSNDEDELEVVLMKEKVGWNEVVGVGVDKEEKVIGKEGRSGVIILFSNLKNVSSSNSNLRLNKLDSFLSTSSCDFNL